MKKGKQKAGKRTSRRKWIFLGVGVAAAGALSYFGWTYYNSKKQEAESEAAQLPDFSAYLPPKPASNPYTAPKATTTQSATADAFPLKKGSKGDKVKKLQEALIAANGKSILPKYGAD